MIDRRTFIAAAGGVAVTRVLPATAQQAKRPPVVGLVFAATPLAEMAGPDPLSVPARGFVHGLRDLGWIDGRSVVIERRSAENDPNRAPDLFADLLARGVDVIAVTDASWLGAAALQATRTIPIVAVFSSDPVAAGVIGSLARPGGNLTGVASATGPEFDSKRLQLLREFAPNITRAAFLGPKEQLKQFAGVAPPAGITIAPVPVEVATHYEAAFATIRAERADALIVGGGPIINQHVKRIIAFTAASRLPAIYGDRRAVDAGGLISYGTNSPGLWRQAARLVHSFLNGAKIGDIPTERPTTFEMVIHAKTAKALGLTIPPLVLAQADVVIE